MPSQNVDFIKKLYKSNTLLDVLISFEDFLDSNDLYAFLNWDKGVVVEGPNLERYWVDITLEYDYKDMPDPDGGKRLLKQGAKVEYRKEQRESTDLPDVQTTDTNPQTRRKEDLPTKTVWLVKITIPRHFIDDVHDQLSDLYAQSVDLDDLTSAKEEGITNKTGLVNDDDDPVDDVMGDEDES